MPTGTERHVQFVQTLDIEDEDRYGRKIDDFLYDMFQRRSPLKFSSLERATRNSQAVVLVTLDLSSTARATGTSFDDAAKDFCQRIFLPSTKRFLGTLTPKSILGVSPVSPRFKRFWNRVFFKEALKHGPPMLQSINTAFKDDYLPNWALALSFAVMGNMTFAFADQAAEVAKMVELFGPGGVAVATLIMQKYVSNKIKANLPTAQQEQEWKTHLSALKVGINLVIGTTAKITAPPAYSAIDRSNEEEDSQVILLDALYDTTLAAAKVHTVNEKFWEAFLYAREKSMQGAALSAVGIGAGMLALDAAVFTTSTVAVAPLAQWGIAGVVGFALTGEAPLVLVTTTWWCPPLFFAGMAATLVTTGFGVKRVWDIKKFNDKAAYHENMKKFIIFAWKVAYFSRLLMEWVNCTDAANPSAVDFVDDEARRNWGEFISKIREATNQSVTARDLTPEFVVGFLKERSEDLKKWREELAKHEKKYLS
ncbi:hypothetical protein MMC30_003910 [Trapelia coarctata]|nr:hypothetical protein [Trapelia coarctata]